MPFKSERQRRYLYANKPTLAKRWTEKYGSEVQPKKSRRKKVKK